MIVNKPNIAGAVHKYFEDKQQLNDSKYNWYFYIMPESSRLDEVPNFIFGGKRRDPGHKQVIAQFENMTIYNDKLLWRNIMLQFDNINNFEMKSSQFHPKSYTICYNCSQFNEEEIKFLLDETYDNQLDIWFIKDPSGLNGRGLTVINNIKQFKNEYYLYKLSPVKSKKFPFFQDNQSTSQVRLVQQSIKNPLLLENRKFDFRIFVLMFCTGNNYIIFSRRSYIRLAFEKYDVNTTSLGSHTTHTTHAKNNATDYDEQQQFIDKVQKNMTEFEQMIKYEYKISDEKLQKLYFDINQVIAYGFLAGLDHIEKTKGVFHLFGVDIMVDSNYQPWFIEVNQWPDLLLFSKTKREEVPVAIKGMIDITNNFLDEWDNMEEYSTKIDNNSEYYEYQILYNSHIFFNILNQKFEHKTNKNEPNKSQQKIDL